MDEKNRTTQSQGSRKRIHSDKTARYLRAPQAAAHYNIGLNTARRLAQEAHAIIRVGRSTLYDTQILDRYLEGLRVFAAPNP